MKHTSYQPKIAKFYCIVVVILSQLELSKILLVLISLWMSCAECKYFKTLQSWYAINLICEDPSIFYLCYCQTTQQSNVSQFPYTRKQGRDRVHSGLL